jgi:23S rRNA pseudouridine2605 synthase
MTLPRHTTPPAAGKTHGLARALASLGIMSRTSAAQAIAAGRVSVNGAAVLDPEARVSPERDRLALDGRPVIAAAPRYLALNKPRGLVTTARDEHHRATVYACLPDAQDGWMAPVGRLDKASEGLILFTNDTRWADRVLSPESGLAKVYHVQIGRHLSEPEISRLCAGVMLDGRLARAEKVQVLRRGEKTCWLEIVLRQGLNRQIRRMLQALDAEVLRLVRVAIGPVQLGDLPKGQSRPLTDSELQAMELALSAGR